MTELDTIDAIEQSVNVKPQVSTMLPHLEGTQSKRKKVLVETWGCQMNIADSENMLATLAQNNYEITESETDADLVLLNTCHIREKAKQKVLSRLGRLKAAKKLNPALKIAVAGCVAQAEGEKLVKAAPQIDVLLGPGQLDAVNDLLEENLRTRKTAVALGFKERPSEELVARGEVEKKPEKKQYTFSTDSKPIHSGKNSVSRFVNIAQGCDNFCTFCIVPHTRGREISRPVEEIRQECETMVREGAREITLLGQNVNSYGSDLIREGKIAPSQLGLFGELLKEICGVDGLERLRFMTSNPHDFTHELADLFFTEPKLGSYLHLPLQSGDDIVLERMKRKVTVAEYKERIDWLRSKDPDFALSTDLIVGFPGETEDQFENTLKMLEYARFSFVYAFMYSPRNKTPAARFQDQVPENEKVNRLARLNEVQDRITLEILAKEVGQVRSALFSYKSSKGENLYYGRTEHFRPVRVYSPVSILGQTLKIRITEGNKTSMIGTLE